MAKPDHYIPEVNDPVLIRGREFVRYVVTVVRHEKKTAGVRTTTSPVIFHQDIPWSSLSYLDKSQNCRQSS
jgi:hypothetical protein